MVDEAGPIKLARVVDMHEGYTGTGFRVFCLELCDPTEYLHVAVLGDTDVKAVVTKDYIDTRLMDAWADTVAEMAAQAASSTISDLSQWAMRWF